MLPDPSQGRIDAWCALDRDEALGAGDAQAIEASRPLRAVIVARVEAGDLHRDLVHACLGMGRLFASFAASPALATGTLDHLRRTLGADADAAWLAPARGALAEGFVGANLERAREDALGAWDVPGCTVKLDDRTVAVACGRHDDGDGLLAWADRSATALARAGYRVAYLSGRERAVEALRRSLAIAGIEVQSPPARPHQDPHEDPRHGPRPEQRPGERRPPFGLTWLRSRRS